MKKIVFGFVVLAFALLGSMVSAAELTGAGSTFVYPILSKWADAYKKETGTSINYQSIGSGGGIKQIQSKTVDFGASDKPMADADLEKDGLTQFPIINGAIVPVIHVEGIKADELKITGPVLADIFAGKIKKWNESAIADLNKGAKLPDQAITVVHRADGSGTTFIFTNYLSKVSPSWKSAVGEDTSVKWPAGVGGKGNEGVANFVKQINGSIGYVEFAYAIENNMTTLQLKNQAGEFVKGSTDAFKSAASGADWAHAKNFSLIMTDAAGKKSWPIAGSTFILMHKISEKPEQSKEALKFFTWAYKNGAMATELHYVPLPETVVKLVEKSWKEQIKN